MERMFFYEFLPTKAREIEIQEKGSPTKVFIRLWNRKNQENNFLELLELQQNVHDELQEAAADDGAHFNHDDHPPQELELQWPIVKTLTKSDVDHHQNRLVLHRSHVDTFFPDWPPSLVRNIAQGGRPHDIIIRDTDALSEHRLLFHRWSSNGLYVIQSNGAKEFVERRRLEAGDVIGLRWNPQMNCCLFSVLERA